MVRLRPHSRAENGGLSDKQLAKVTKGNRVAAAIQKKAEAVQEYWKSVAPVFGETGHEEHREAPPRGRPGAYRDSIIIVDTSDEDGASARVRPTDWKAKIIEFGSSHMPEYAPKAKTLAKFRR